MVDTLSVEKKRGGIEMCDKCNSRIHKGASKYGRREFIKAGAAALAVAPLVGVAANVHAAKEDEKVGEGPYPTVGYGTNSATSPLKLMNIERRALGSKDVLIDVMYCGVCHSDIHQARNEWPNTVPTTYPVIPGHEIIDDIVGVAVGVPQKF